MIRKERREESKLRKIEEIKKNSINIPKNVSQVHKQNRVVPTLMMDSHLRQIMRPRSTA